jgi:hypothetical protein
MSAFRSYFRIMLSAILRPQASHLLEDTVLEDIGSN